MHAQPQIRHKRSGPGVGAPHDRDLNQFSLSLRAWVFHPNTRRHVRLLGPCFKTGRFKPLRQHPKHVNVGLFPDLCRRAEFLNPNHRMRPWAITHPKMPHSHKAFVRRSKLMLTRRPESKPSANAKVDYRSTRLT
jgi:hypothetical protein